MLITQAPAGIAHAAEAEQGPAQDPVTAAEDDAGREVADPTRFQLVSPDGDYRLELGIAAQLWVNYERAEKVPVGPTAYDYVAEFLRIRLGLGGNAFTRAFTYELQLSVLPGKFEMLDLYGDYAFAPAFRVRLGVWKIPFTRLRTRSFADRQLVEWPIVTRYFGAERQLGIALHNGYTDASPPRFEWAVGAFTGVNIRGLYGVGPSLIDEEEDEEKDEEKEDDLPGSRVNEPFHPEIVVRVGYNHGSIDTRSERDFEGSLLERGPLRFAFHLSGTWDARPVAGVDWGFRVAAEGLVKYRGCSLAASFYLATLQYGSSPSYHLPRAAGAWVATGIVIARRVEIAGEYAWIRSLDDGGHTHQPRLGVNVFLAKRRIQIRADIGGYFDRGGHWRGSNWQGIQLRSLVQMTL